MALTAAIAASSQTATDSNGDTKSKSQMGRNPSMDEPSLASSLVTPSTPAADRAWSEDGEGEEGGKGLNGDGGELSSKNGSRREDERTAGRAVSGDHAGGEAQQVTPVYLVGNLFFCIVLKILFKIKLAVWYA